MNRRFAPAVIWQAAGGTDLVLPGAGVVYTCRNGCVCHGCLVGIISLVGPTPLQTVNQSHCPHFEACYGPEHLVVDPMKFIWWLCVEAYPLPLMQCWHRPLTSFSQPVEPLPGVWHEEPVMRVLGDGGAPSVLLSRAPRLLPNVHTFPLWLTN